MLNVKLDIFYLIPALAIIDFILLYIQSSSPIDNLAEILTNIYHLFFDFNLYGVLRIIIDLLKPFGILYAIFLILLPVQNIRIIYLYMLNMGLNVMWYLLCDILIFCAFIYREGLFCVSLLLLFLFLQIITNHFTLSMCNTHFINNNYNYNDNLIKQFKLNVKPVLFKHFEQFSNSFNYLYILVLCSSALLQSLTLQFIKFEPFHYPYTTYPVSFNIYYFTSTFLKSSSSTYDSVLKKTFNSKIINFPIITTNLYFLFTLTHLGISFANIWSVFMHRFIPIIYHSFNTYYLQAKESCQLYGVTFWIESEMARLNLPTLFRLYWALRSAYFFTYFFIFTDKFKVFFNGHSLFEGLRQIILIKSCDSFLIIIASSAIMCHLLNVLEDLFQRYMYTSPPTAVSKISSNVLNASNQGEGLANTQSYRVFNPSTNNVPSVNNTYSASIGKTVAFIFVISAAQTGLSNIQSKSLKLDRLGRNFVITWLAALHYIHDILVAPTFTQLALKSPFKPNSFANSNSNFNFLNPMGQDVKAWVFATLGFFIFPMLLCLIPAWHLQHLWQPLGSVEPSIQPPSSSLAVGLAKSYSSLFDITAFPQFSNHLNTWLISVTILCVELLVKIYTTFLLYLVRKCDSYRNALVSTNFADSTNSETFANSTGNEPKPKQLTSFSALMQHVLITMPYVLNYTFNYLSLIAYSFHLHKIYQYLSFKMDFDVQVIVLRVFSRTKIEILRAYVCVKRNVADFLTQKICSYNDPEWELLIDQLIWRITFFGHACEFICGIGLFENALWILIFESNGLGGYASSPPSSHLNVHHQDPYLPTEFGSGGGGAAVRASMTLLHFYFNLWLKGRDGYLSLRRRYRVNAIVSRLSSEAKQDEDNNFTADLTTADASVICCPICRYVLQFTNNSALTPSTSTTTKSANIWSAHTRHVISTPCGHVYHKYCLQKWLYKKEECPLCRQNLSLT